MSKYFFAVALVTALTFSSLGCGQQSSAPTPDTPPEVTTSPQGSEAMPMEGSDMKPMEGAEAMLEEAAEAMPMMEGSDMKSMEGSETK